MSGEPPGGNRTEPPTPRRLRQARRQGEVARSRELSGAVALTGGLVAVAGLGPLLEGRLASYLRSSLSAAVAGDLRPLVAVREALRLLAITTLPIAGAALCAGGLAAALQVGGVRFASQAVAWRLGRLDPLRGLRRLCAAGQVASLGLGLVKIAAAGLLAWRCGSSRWRAVAQLPRLEPGPAAVAVVGLLAPLVTDLCALLAAFGLADLLWAHRRHRRSLRMARQEVRRDLREQEGDPHYKAERQRLHRALANAAPLSRATCVVVNPTELAVALWHRRGSEEAPVVLAKGRGTAAARLRRQARRAGVPLVREIALARALFQLAEVGDEIPEELYQAAATVLLHVYGARAPEIRP